MDGTGIYRAPTPTFEAPQPIDLADIYIKGEQIKAMKVKALQNQNELQFDSDMDAIYRKGIEGNAGGNMLAGNPPPPSTAQVPQAPQNMIAKSGANALSSGQPSATGQPTDKNALAGDQPAVGPKDIESLYKKETTGDEPVKFDDKKYEIRVPGRPTTEWLQEQVRTGKIHPKAAYMFDMGTQQLKAQEEKKYQQQAAEYFELNGSEIREAREAIDMKKLSSILQEAKTKLPNNPIVQRNSDFMLEKIRSGVIIRPEKEEKEPASNDVLIRQEIEDDLRKDPANKGKAERWIRGEAAKKTEAIKSERKVDDKQTMLEMAKALRPEKEAKPEAEELAYQLDKIRRENPKLPLSEAKHMARMAVNEQKTEAKVDYASKVTEARLGGKQKAADMQFAQIDEPLPKALEVVSQSIATKGELPKDFMSMRDPNALRIIARAKTINPDLDLAKEDVLRKLANSPSMEKTAFVARQIIPNIKKFEKEVDKLEFSDVKIIGQVEEFFKGNLQKSALTAAAARRADLMMNIAQVSKGTGATDQTIQQEASVLNHAASREEVHSWAKAQTEALEPMVKQYEEINKIKTGERRKELDSGKGESKKENQPFDMDAIAAELARRKGGK